MGVKKTNLVIAAYWFIGTTIFIVCISVALLLNGACDSNILNASFTGRIVKLFEDPNNHAIPTVIVINEKNKNNKISINYEFYNLLHQSDSITKVKDSMYFYYKKKGEWRSFRYECD